MSAPLRASGRLVSVIKRGCWDKLRYADQFAARAAGQYSQEKGDVRLYIYACDICRGYHLTRSKQRDKTMKVDYDFTTPVAAPAPCRPAPRADEETVFAAPPAPLRTRPRTNLAGLVHGHLRALHYWGAFRRPTGVVDYKWVCSCSCGRYCIRTAATLTSMDSHDRCAHCRDIASGRTLRAPSATQPPVAIALSAAASAGAPAPAAARYIGDGWLSRTGALLFRTLPPARPWQDTGFGVPPDNLTGLVNGTLTVVQYWGRIKSASGRQGQRWVCRCNCGLYTVARASSLMRPNPRMMCAQCAEREQSNWLAQRKAA